MRHVFKSLVGVLVTGALTAAIPVPAQARPDGYRDYHDYRWSHGRHRYRDHDRPRYRHYHRYKHRDYRHFRDYPRGYYSYRGRPRVYYHDHYRDDSGAVLAAGIIGLAIGAAIASRDDYDRYDRHYRDYDYYYDD